MEDTKNKYNFSQKIDEIPFGKIGGQLDILILTPRSDEYDNIAILGYRDGYDLILRLPEEMTYWKEIQQSLRIASYVRSEEHTSELQSRQYLVCRLLLEKKKT